MCNNDHNILQNMGQATGYKYYISSNIVREFLAEYLGKSESISNLTMTTLIMITSQLLQ